MTNETMPADWAIEKALVPANTAFELDIGRPWTVAMIKEDYQVPYAATTLAFARYIEAHEKPPVDRKLLCAREAGARHYEALGVGYEIAAGQYREGLSDKTLPVVLEAITLWEEGFGNDQH